MDIDIDGLRLACRYGWNCEKAKALSMRKFDASEFLFNFAIGANQNATTIKKILEHLGSFEFLKKIAGLNEKDIFDHDVVSYYWKGSPDLKGGMELTHNFTTLFDLLEYNLPMGKIEPVLIDKCLIRNAEVIRMQNPELHIKYFPVVKYIGTGLKLSQKNEEKKIDCIVRQKVKSGDIITMHFGTAVEIITPKEAKKLHNITQKALMEFNKRCLEKTP